MSLKVCELWLIPNQPTRHVVILWPVITVQVASYFGWLLYVNSKFCLTQRFVLPLRCKVCFSIVVKGVLSIIALCLTQRFVSPLWWKVCCCPSLLFASPKGLFLHCGERCVAARHCSLPHPKVCFSIVVKGVLLPVIALCLTQRFVSPLWWKVCCCPSLLFASPKGLFLHCGERCVAAHHCSLPHPKVCFSIVVKGVLLPVIALCLHLKFFCFVPLWWKVCCCPSLLFASTQRCFFFHCSERCVAVCHCSLPHPKICLFFHCGERCVASCHCLCFKLLQGSVD